jgi:flagellar motor switch protein FliG
MLGDLGLLDPFSLMDGLALRPARLRGADLLELLGEDEDERIENVMAMLRRSSPEDVNELARIVQQALQRVAQERATQ